MTHNHNSKLLGYELKEPIVNMIVVAIHNQSLHALDKNGKTIFSYNCATGSAGNLTPLGHFHVDKRGYSLQEAEKHESSDAKARGAPMPYPMYIDNHRGIAIHGSGLVTKYRIKIPGIIETESYLKRFLPNSIGENIGSHACVRLSADNALELYLHTPQGTPVVIRKFWVDDTE